MQAAFIDVDGVQTRYLFEGDRGMPVLLVHGLGVSADLWLRNIDVLARDFRVVAPDLLGHGFTDGVDLAGGPPQPRLVEHVLGVADALGFERFAIVGSSLGALVSSLVYFAAPDRVRGLVIVGSGSTFNTDEELARSVTAAFDNAIDAIDHPSVETSRRRLANIQRDPSTVPEEILLAQITSYARPAVKAFYREAVAGIKGATASKEHRVYDRLEEIAVPVMLVSGHEDPRAHFERAVQAAERIPDCTLVPVSGCGHQPHVEHPALFNERVGAFLRGLAA